MVVLFDYLTFKDGQLTSSIEDVTSYNTASEEVGGEKVKYSDNRKNPRFTDALLRKKIIIDIFVTMMPKGEGAQKAQVPE